MHTGTLKKFVVPLWLLLAFLPAAARAGTSLPAPTWNCSVQDGQTQLEFIFQTRVVYHYFTLSHPQRLVIDLDSTRLPQQPANEASGCGLVKSLDWAERKHQVLRYVLNLSHKAPVQLLPSPQKKGTDFHLLVRIGTLQKPVAESNHIASADS
ncbi:MAG: AMIN domain-containing protein, partial [Gammaproteobacteria bacterium]